MMRGKSQPSELTLEKMKFNSSLVFEEHLEKEIISFLSKNHYVVLLHVY